MVHKPSTADQKLSIVVLKLLRSVLKLFIVVLKLLNVIQKLLNDLHVEQAQVRGCQSAFMR